MESDQPQIGFGNIGSLRLNEISQAVREIEHAENIVNSQLRNALEVYDQIKSQGVNIQQSSLSLVTTILENIEGTVGYFYFLQLFGEIEYPIDPKTTRKPKELFDIFKKIEGFGMPTLPWPRENEFWLFDKETEQKLCQPGTHDVSQTNFLGNFKFLPQVDDVVIQNLLNPKFNERKNHILKIFLNLSIAEVLEYEPTVEMIDLRTKESVEKTTGWILDSQKGKIEIRNYIKDLFKSVFEQTKEEVIRERIMPTEDIIKDDSWKTIIQAANSFRKSLLSLKNQFPDTISKLKVEQENYLFQEIRNFLNVNKLNELVIPSRGDIENFKGGKGLIKRISTTIGMPKAKVNYTPWLVEQLEKENSNKTEVNSIKEKKEVIQSEGYLPKKADFK